MLCLGHLFGDCFDNIAHRLLGHKRAFAKCKSEIADKSYLFGMISYDVIGDYMSDLDDVRKRIEKRKRPLNDHNFKKLYNGMVRLMVMMIVVLGSLIVLKNPELEQKIFNQKYLQQLITFVSQSVLDFTRRC